MLAKRALTNFTTSVAALLPGAAFPKEDSKSHVRYRSRRDPHRYSAPSTSSRGPSYEMQITTGIRSRRGEHLFTYLDQEATAPVPPKPAPTHHLLTCSIFLGTSFLFFFFFFSFVVPSILLPIAVISATSPCLLAGFSQAAVPGDDQDAVQDRTAPLSRRMSSTPKQTERLLILCLYGFHHGSRAHRTLYTARDGCRIGS